MKHSSGASRRFAHLATRVLLIAYGLIVLYPLAWTVLASFKSAAEFYESPFALPRQWVLHNYENAFEKAHIGSYFVNSVTVSVAAVLLGNLLAFASSYALARFRFPFSKWISLLYMAGLFVPVVVSVVPMFMLLHTLSLLDSRIGLILVYTATSMSFTVYLLRGYLIGVPREYEEAAMIDGCSHYGILFRIVAPMSVPGLITVTIFNFMAFWNEYILAVSFVSSESKRTLTLGLAYLMEVQRYATDWGALFAGLVIVMLPTLVVYVFLQRKITSGISMEGLKG